MNGSRAEWRFEAPRKFWEDIYCVAPDAIRDEMVSAHPSLHHCWVGETDPDESLTIVTLAESTARFFEYNLNGGE